MIRRTSPAVLISLISVVAFAAVTKPGLSSIQIQEHAFSRTLSRATQFVDVQHITSSSKSCEDTHPPEALATPDPLFNVNGRKVRVSFIIGTDGRVHSPLILESAGIAGDRRVLQTVRTWRYRPATCNGVPTEIEGKIEFSSR